MTITKWNVINAWFSLVLISLVMFLLSSNISTATEPGLDSEEMNQYQDTEGEIAVVPELATIFLLGSGLLAFAKSFRKNKQ